MAARRLDIPADVIIPVSQVRPELFAAAGTRFGFDEELIAPLVNAIGQQLERLAP